MRRIYLLVKYFFSLRFVDVPKFVGVYWREVISDEISQNFYWMGNKGKTEIRKKLLQPPEAGKN